ncbi:MAG TPA: hypothetical protein PLX35_03230 [Cyclobacteriaceae bacterium]|nr:hypothetical protein [Cyclobacteriaceae bacterium]
MRQTTLCILASCWLLTSCSFEKLYQAQIARAHAPYEVMDFHALTQRYMKKEKVSPVEGIYSVSGVVTKKGKALLGSAEKEKVTDRQDNYAQVAILADGGETGRDFIEVSLNKTYLPRYPVIGEFTRASGGNILVYKHLEAHEKSSSYTFTYDANADMLEGIRVETEGNTTVTYKLTYVKVYPKN